MFKLKGFGVWSNGDQMSNAQGQKVKLNAASGNGSNWLHLTDGLNKIHQLLGIVLAINTINGAIYTLQLDYAGDLGLANNKGIIGIYVDNQLVASYNNSSDNTALNWQALSFQFAGNGNSRTIRIQLEGGTASNGRGAMLNNIRIVETLPQQVDTVYAIAGQARRLPIIQVYTPDQDGSETLSLQLTGLAAGTVLTDGTHYFSASAGTTSVSITDWNLSNLNIAAPSGYSGDMQLQLVATSTEQVNGQTLHSQRNMTVRVLQGQMVQTPFSLSAAAQVQAAPVSLGIVGSVHVLGLESSIQLQVAARLDEDEITDQQQAQLQSDDWIQHLEQFAQQNWQQYQD